MAGGSVTIRKDVSGTLVVDITSAAGGTPTFYSNAALTASVSFPDSITTSKTYYIGVNDQYVLSVKRNGLEIANSPDGTRSFRLEDTHLSVSPGPDASNTEAASEGASLSANNAFTGTNSFAAATAVAAGTAALPGVYPTGDTDTGIWSPAADTLAVSTGREERMRIDASGNVGIGVTPTSSLDVGSESAYQPQVTVRNTNVDANGAYLFINKMPSDNTIATSDNIGNLFYQAANTSGVAKTVAGISVAAEGANTAEAPPGRMLFYVANSAGALSERMRIDNAGLITGTGTSLGAWTAYTPTLGGTGWAIGNGTATGAYCRIGKIVHFRIRIVLGATSTAGAGALTLPLPVTGITQTTLQGVTRVYDASAGLTYQNNYRADASTITPTVLGALGLEASYYTTTNPITWATGDHIYVNGTYEAA